jgi:hypothetical protein
MWYSVTAVVTNDAREVVKRYEAFVQALDVLAAVSRVFKALFNDEVLQEDLRGSKVPINR